MSARDSFSPVAPARVRVLVLPAGRIKRSRFLTFFNLLAQTHEVRLGDVRGDARPDRAMFSPLNFPDGQVLYDFTISEPAENHLALSPFELFREPFVALGLADWAEYSSRLESNSDHSESSGALPPSDSSLNSFESLARELRARYPRILLHQVLLFDSPFAESRDFKFNSLAHVPPVDRGKSTTMKTIVCDITAALLAEMSTFAKSIQALPSITTPSQGHKPANGGPITQRFRDATLVRTNSLGASRPRSVSPAVQDDLNIHRMSMPVFASSNSAASSPTGGSRPTSPDSGPRKLPARTFEEISGHSSVPELHSTSGELSSSQDRVSTHGFGSGSLDEWNRNKGQCRIGIVVASLHIQAGRWRDAMKDLMDNALKAKAFSDHLWHAKALENILVCMILLAWSRLDFQIPSICYPIPDRTVRAAQSTPVSSSSDLTPVTGTPSSRPADLNALSQLIPDLANMIISIYTRPLSVTGEFLPELAFSETTIRLSKILAALHLAGGTLTDDVLQSLVNGTLPKPYQQSLAACRLTINPTRSSIESFILRAYPDIGEGSDLSSVDRVMILAGMASVFSTLGLQRKKSLLVTEYMDALTYAINDGKRMDAAQAGFHPSAGMTTFSPVGGSIDQLTGSPNGVDNLEFGLEDFLNILCRVHGIPEANWSETIGFEALHGDQTNGTDDPKVGDSGAVNGSSASISDKLVGNFVLRSFGSVNIKADVLRSCIQLCEALSDVGGILHYTAALLTTAGPGIAPSFDSGDSLITLSREEQLSLIGAITKTAADAKLIGINAEAEFWDEFLVRGLYTLESLSGIVLRQQKHSDFNKAKKKRGPESTFKMVHDPFANKPTQAEARELIVAGEEREFVITLQNPYEFEVDVERVRILSGVIVIGSSTHGFILRPSRTQSISISGTIMNPGTVSIDACVIKVRGCRERRFSIFSEPWTPIPETKMKNIGLLKSRSQKSRPKSDESTSSQTGAVTLSSFPPPSVISLTVIPAQPSIIVKEGPSSEVALMLLEGERKKVSITLCNESDTVGADFFQLIYKDTSSAAMLDAISNGNLPPSELHELEYQLTHFPAIQLCNVQPLSMGPGETKSFEFEILGKPGLTNATVVFLYANISMSHVEDKNIFYSRELTVAFSITVNASILLHRFDVLPFSGTFHGSIRQTSTHTNSTFDPLTEHQGRLSLIKQMQLAVQSQPPQEYFLVVLDLRNGWPAPITTSVYVDSAPDGEEDFSPQIVHELIQPGHISRFVLLVPKIYLSQPHQPIKPLHPENERQFVVSTSASSIEAERTNRELFWYREALLSLLRANWSFDSSGRSGSVDLRALRLTLRMIDTIRLDDLSIEFEVTASDPQQQHSARKINRGTFEVQLEEDLIFTTKLTNRSERTIYPLLRIQPSWAQGPHDPAVDLGKRMTLDGTLQKTLSPIGPGETSMTATAICMTCSGEVDIGAVVEEYRVSEDLGEAEGNSRRPRMSTGTIPDVIGDIAGRRMWTASQTCRLIAR